MYNKIPAKGLQASAFQKYVSTWTSDYYYTFRLLFTQKAKKPCVSLQEISNRSI